MDGGLEIEDESVNDFTLRELLGQIEFETIREHPRPDNMNAKRVGRMEHRLADFYEERGIKR